MLKIYKIVLEEKAKNDFGYWMNNDKNIVNRIELLLNDIRSTPESGIGKPEKLKHSFSGYWSRRINQEHRLIYKVIDDVKIVHVFSCKGHYSLR